MDRCTGLICLRWVVFGMIVQSLAFSGIVGASVSHAITDRNEPVESVIDESVDIDCINGPTDASRSKATSIASGEQPSIIQLYPNTRTRGNIGEYIVIEFPTSTDVSNFSITDGHSTATFPNTSVAGRIAFSMDPNVSKSKTDYRTKGLEGYLRIAVNGDELRLYDGDTPVDSVRYSSAPTGSVWFRETPGGTGTWWPRGATCLRPISSGSATGTTFVLPDAPTVPERTLSEATESIQLAGYTFTSEETKHALAEAIDRDVEVRILIEANPVGGMAADTRRVLDSLDEAGATVRVIGGSGSRYVFHHPKYAIVDDSVMVLTENWKPSGTGGAASRGWGVVLSDSEVSATVRAVFEADFRGPDTQNWTTYSRQANFVDSDPARGSFSKEFEPKTVRFDGVELLLAPDNAEGRLLELIEGAEETIRIKQVNVPDPDLSLVRATVDAARRGVDVEFLLDSTWYVEEENERFARHIERIAESEELSIDVTLVEPDPSAFRKIHAKGVIIDDDTVVLGSLNWNANSLRNNREVVVVLYGAEPTSYFDTVFSADLADDAWELPIELVAVVTVGLALAGVASKRRLTMADPVDA